MKCGGGLHALLEEHCGPSTCREETSREELALYAVEWRLEIASPSTAQLHTHRYHYLEGWVFMVDCGSWVAVLHVGLVAIGVGWWLPHLSKCEPKNEQQSEERETTTRQP